MQGGGGGEIYDSTIVISATKELLQKRQALRQIQPIPVGWSLTALQTTLSAAL